MSYRLTASPTIPGHHSLFRGDWLLNGTSYQMMILKQKNRIDLDGSEVEIWEIVYFWLVVDLPLWKMMEFVSWDYEIPNIWKVIKFMFQTTNQIYSQCFLAWARKTSPENTSWDFANSRVDRHHRAVFLRKLLIFAIGLPPILFRFLFDKSSGVPPWLRKPLFLATVFFLLGYPERWLLQTTVTTRRGCRDGLFIHKVIASALAVGALEIRPY